MTALASLYTLAWLIPAAPLLAALLLGLGYLAGLNRGEAGERSSANIALTGTAFALALLLVLDALALWQGAPGTIAFGTWFHSGDLSIRLNLQLDALGLAMATLVSFLLLLTLRFAVNYLHREAGFQRFFMVLSLFASGMLLIILAGNAVLMFVGWEMAGVSSFLLIAYAYQRQVATQNANYAFISNRIGDAGFIFALYLGYQLTGSSDWSVLNSQAGTQGSLYLGLLLGGFLLAALAKSAVLPFAAWISRALEGPTPSSAIFYGAVMVHAGVYLLLRLQFLLEQVPVLMGLLFLLGLLTALYGWLAGLVQTDVKSALMFSTTAQIGLMVAECGLGWFDLAAWHLAAHAIWRSWQFLGSPDLLYKVHRPARPVPAWLQDRIFLYTAALQRFWLDQLAEHFLLRPTAALSREVRDFDEKVLHRLIGQPTTQRGTPWAETVGTGRGLSGRLMEKLAAAFAWFEEHLILHGSGAGLLKLLNHLGRYMLTVEKLLGQPRYLVVLIVVTFVVIL